MATTYRFIERPGLPSQVVAWFRAYPSLPEEIPTNRGYLFCFRDCGDIAWDSEGNVDPKNSPVVTVFLPRVVRGALWTVGEIHFLATPLKERFPPLHKISTSFANWLKQFECVYSNKPGSVNSWNYYLEGSTKNYDPPIYALPSGLSALQGGRYFVGDDDSSSAIDKLCSTLRLRGVETDAAA